MKKKYLFLGAGFAAMALSLTSCIKSSPIPSSTTNPSVPSVTPSSSTIIPSTSVSVEDLNTSSQAQVEKVTISFNTLGGNNINSIEVEKNTLATTLPTPEKASTVEYNYTFAGWYTDIELTTAFDNSQAVSTNVTLYAKYNETVREYSITWLDIDDSILKTDSVAYGEMPSYNPEKEGYNFVGWSPIVLNVKGNATYKANWISNNQPYTAIWKNGDTELFRKEVAAGENADYEGATPTKDSTDEWNFTFTGWEIASTTDGEVIYNATFTSIKRKYNITFKNGDTILQEKEIEYGQLPTFDGEEPTKESTVESTYSFTGWDSELSNVTGDKVYVAQFEETVREYTYTFYNEDGTAYKSIRANYNTDIEAPKNPTKAEDLNKTYAFDGWYDAKTGGNKVTEFGKLTSNVSYYARFTSTDKKYTITWKNGDTTLKVDTDSLYSKEYTGAAPEKDGFEFTGNWVETFESSTEIIRAAEFREIKDEYTVTWLDSEGKTLKTTIVENGQLAAYGTTPSKAGNKFLYWTKDGVEFDLNTPISMDITLKAVFAEVVSYGFGSNYTSWSELVTKAGSSVTTGSSDRKVLNKDVSFDNGFTFKNNDKNFVAKNSASYNNQGADIIVELTKKGDIIVNCSWASSTSAGKITVKDSSSNVKYESSTIKGSGTNCSFTVFDLPAGTYTISSEYSINITNIHYEVIKEYATVSYVANNGDSIEATRVVVGEKLKALPELQKDNYKFAGWYLDSLFNTEFDINKAIDENVTLYAKWTELTQDEKATVTFNVNVDGIAFESITVEKGKKIILPSQDKTGYRFDAWYTNSSHTQEFNANNTIDSDITLYGNYIKQWTITYQDKDGNVITTKKVDNETAFGEVAVVSAPYISGYLFDYWTNNNQEYTATDDITSDIGLKAHYKEDDGTGDVITITRQEGLQESAYILFDEFNNADSYSLYEIDSDNTTRKLSEKEYYVTRTQTGYRADLIGLKKGNHKVIVVPEISGTDVVSLGSIATFSVEEYDRSGYAHFNAIEGVGAYNNDGTLKDNAIVLYVTDQNKNTVELSYGGITVRGIGNILNSVGQDCGEEGHEGQCKKVSSGKTYYAQANTNQGIIKKLAEANIPLVIRFVGCVSNTGLYSKGTFNAASTSLIDGLTTYDSNDFGGSEGDNGHMARIKSGKNITLEGVGSDATIDGWGFHFICESSATSLGKGFEVRNLKFINTPEDAIGMEGQQEGSKITASVERCWIHNNEFYSPSISSPAESDKSEGDGSVDFKRGMYFTCSYNYFEGCHKTNLVGSSDSSLQYNLTYHHNYWYLCKARGPLTRQANVHMYNNIFYGQTDYAMNTRANAYIFSESNLFYACKSPQAVESGAIKSYNDSISSALWNKGSQATVVTDKSTKVASSCAYNGVSYSSFELDDSLFYVNDYYLQEDPTDAKKVIYARCGTAKASLPAIEDITMDDISYVNEAVKNATITNLNVNGSTTTISKISKTIYAFRITDSATATISFESDADATTGVLCNQAGVCLLKGSGTVELKPGVYFIQPYNFQPGDSKALTQLVFKEIKNITLKLDEFDDSAYQAQLISEFNALVDALPTIEYNESCYAKINQAYSKYGQLNANSKVIVASKYNTLVNADQGYRNAGVSYVEGKINQIVTPVSSSNSDYVYQARTAYNGLLTKFPDITVSNYNKLVSAENELESIAVAVFISKVNELPSTITYTNECLVKIQNAEAAYSQLTDAQKALDDEGEDVVSAYEKLVGARNTYDYLEAEANKVTITFVVEGQENTTARINKNTKVTLPTNPTKTGYRFAGWYTDSSKTLAFDSNSFVDIDTTLYAKFVEQVEVSFKNMDGSTLTTRLVDKNNAIAQANIPNGKFVSGYKFKHWSLAQSGNEFDFTTEISDAVTLYAVYEESNVSAIEVTLYGGEQESLYAEFNKLEGFTDYNVYVKRDGDSLYKLLDKQLIREYPSNYRVDAVGLKAGIYSIKLVPFGDSNEYNEAETVVTNIEVKAHIRTGFAFVNGSSSGAYNDDGTLKSDATVIYVTNSNKDTVTFNGATGVQNIITLLKGGKGYNKPIDIRFIGNIDDPAVLSKGDLYVDGATSGLTIEGIGKDATINGFGIVVKNSSNVEIRNLGFMNCNSSEGDSIGLQQANDHCWVHNNDIFYGDAGSDADQVKGDGALDTKKSTYITHSFNHFWDTGKSNLQGMKDETTSNYITYHHNWYDHSDSRHPRIRTCTVHIYNNYFDGNAKYGVGMTMGGSAFVENNYFRSTTTMKPMLISGQGTDAKGDGTFSGETGGVIKAYGNKFDGSVSFIPHTESATSFDAYVATSRDEVVPSTYKALSGGTTYNNFDTSSMMYSYDVETPDQAKVSVTTYAGRIQGGDLIWNFNNATDDSSYAVDTKLKAKLVAYKGTTIRVLGLENTSSSTTPVEDTSADDVIALINALPEPANVTLDNTAEIYAARSAYQKLSAKDQESVTNYSKLQQCISRLNELGNDDENQDAQVLTFPKNNSFFTVVGNESSSKGNVTYNGTTYGTCLKMESSTKITFTTTSSSTLTLVFDTASKKVIVDNVEYTTDSNGVVTITLTSGSHEIKKKDSINLFYLSLE